MPSFRRLPPFLRVVSAIGLLFIIAGLMLQLNPHWLPFHAPQADLEVIALNLLILGLACSAVVTAFTRRLRQPDRRRRIPLDSWQSQARAVALAMVVPLCGFIVTLAASPSFAGTHAFWVIMFVMACWPLVVIRLLALG